MKKQVSIHPLLLAAYPVLFLYSNNVGSTDAHVIWKPLALILFAASMSWLSLKSLLKNKVRICLRQRPSDADRALWVTVGGDRLTYSGLRQILRRRANKAGVTPPALHSFRRLFAVQCLRNGMDLRRPQKLMGHSDLQMLIRYTKLVTDDLRAAHLQASPVDNADW